MRNFRTGNKEKWNDASLAEYGDDCLIPEQYSPQTYAHMVSVVTPHFMKAERFAHTDVKHIIEEAEKTVNRALARMAHCPCANCKKRLEEDGS